MDDSIPQAIYSIKTYGNRPFRLVTQNKNGPCPILAIYNLLALRGTVKVPAVSGLSAEEMIQSIGEIVLTDSANQSELIEANTQAALEICSSRQLVTGLDINVKFCSVSSFEFNPAISLLDILQIKLYHLWIIDSSEPNYAIIKDLSYNQLVEKSFTDEDCKEWHDRTCNQTTEVGLIQLLESMKNGEIAILFRNNHYLTITKQNDKLFSLVTDQGYLEAKQVIWEEINFHGGGDFFNENFVTKDQVIEQDAQLAREMTQDDEKLARQLQLEENQSRGINPPLDPVMYQQHAQQQRLRAERKDKCNLM